MRRLFCLYAFALLLFAASTSAQTTSGVVISGLYGAGGNSGATLNADYLELFNGGTTAVSLNGWAIQYASATGTTITTLSPIENGHTLPPGGYFLISATPGTNGAAIPVTPDIVMTTATPQIAFAATAGKVYLTNSVTKLATVCPMNSDPSVIDAIAFGTTASCSLGSGPAPAPSTTTADLRAAVCTNHADNSMDFSIQSLTGSPVIRNSSSTATPCGVVTSLAITAAAFTPPAVNAGSATLLTATVTTATGATSTTVTANLSNLGGSSTQPLYDDGTHGDLHSGDGIYSFSYTIPAATAAKTYSVPVSASDNVMHTVSTNASLEVDASGVLHDSISLSVSSTTLLVGSNLTLTATVSTTDGTVAPGGSVDFYSDNIKIGTGTLTAGTGTSSTATFGTTSLAIGTHSLTAIYTSNGTYPTATTPTGTTVTVNAVPVPDFGLAVSNTAVVLNDSQKTFITTVAVNFINGFSSPVSLSCTGLPSGSRCGFSPSTLSANGNSALTIAIDGASLAPHSSPFGSKSGTLFAFALLTLPFALRRRVRQRLGSAGTALGLLLLGAALVSAATGCSSGSITSSGQSTVTVTATGGSITHTQTIALTIQ